MWKCSLYPVVKGLKIPFSFLKVLTPTFKLQRNKAKDKYQAVSTHEVQSSHLSIDGFSV